MINVTQTAAQELRQILAQNASDPKQVLRIDASSREFSLEIGWAREGDVVVETDGAAVLHIPSEMSQVLAGYDVVIDLVDTADGPQLTIYRAEECSYEVSECDCGCNGHDHEDPL